MNSTLTLNAAASTDAKTIVAKTITVRQIKRTLACKWDLLAVVGLLTSSSGASH